MSDFPNIARLFLEYSFVPVGINRCHGFQVLPGSISLDSVELTDCSELTEEANFVYEKR
jgi:hypothetical protein